MNLQRRGAPRYRIIILSYSSKRSCTVCPHLCVLVHCTDDDIPSGETALVIRILVDLAAQLTADGDLTPIERSQPGPTLTVDDFLVASRYRAKVSLPPFVSGWD
jgi:hypothetical protein